MPYRHPNSNKSRVVFISSFFRQLIEIKSSNASIFLHSLVKKSLQARTLAAPVAASKAAHGHWNL
jgi:hypothetical protein